MNSAESSRMDPIRSLYLNTRSDELRRPLVEIPIFQQVESQISISVPSNHNSWTPFRSSTPTFNSDQMAAGRPVRHRGSSSSSSSTCLSTCSSAASTAPSEFRPIPWAQTVDDYTLPCDSSFSGCFIEFHPREWEEWISHSLTHFVSHSPTHSRQIPPPPVTQCIFCPTTFEGDGDTRTNWDIRMKHIGAHFGNQDATRTRPDFFTIKYMRKHGLLGHINDEAYAGLISYSERTSEQECGILVSSDYKTPEMRNRQQQRVEASRQLAQQNLVKEERQFLREKGRAKRKEKVRK